jgi:RNA polymerase sigma-70 factor (ECF subfamily)
MGGYALPAATEEEQVLRSCRDGAEDGLDLLYRRYAPALVAFCHHRLGNNSDAEDAAHEAILKAHRALPRFREGARLWPWLATIAANVCTDMQRSRERLSPEQDAIDCEAPEMDEDVSRRLRASIVETALNELPERLRTPLFLREFMGWSYEEIAAFSNKSLASVRTTLMRSRRAFQVGVENVARRRGQWPLPAIVVGAWRRTRTTVRQWRDSASRTGNEAANALWRAEGLLAAVAPGLQAAAVAMVAAGTLAVLPAGATTADLPGAVARPIFTLATATAAGATAGTTGTASRGTATTTADASAAAPQAPVGVSLRASDKVAGGTPADAGIGGGIHPDDNGKMQVDHIVILGAPVDALNGMGAAGETSIPCHPPVWSEICRQLRGLSPPPTP